MRTDTKIQLWIFIGVAIMNGVFIATGPNRLLHFNIALAFLGWALSLRVSDSWRDRALKAEANR